MHSVTPVEVPASGTPPVPASFEAPGFALALLEPPQSKEMSDKTIDTTPPSVFIVPSTFFFSW